MIKAILIDDEKDALISLESKLKLYCPQVEVLETCLSPKDGFIALQKEKPDVLFLDIEMPLINGFDFLEMLGEDIDFEVIFVTAYDEYALKAFKFSVLDYLLKPIIKEDLIKAVERVEKNKLNVDQNKLKELKKGMNIGAGLRRIMIPTNDGIEIIVQNDILYCKADSNYTYIFTSDGKKITASKTLAVIEKHLDSTLFTRVHHSYTVNLKAIVRLSTKNGDEVLLKNEAIIPVSRRKKDNLLQNLQNLEDL